MNCVLGAAGYIPAYGTASRISTVVVFPFGSE
jgi:hypothetical protein